MKHYIFSAALVLAPAALLAQSQSETQQDTDKGYLTTLIEDNLSGDTRDVNIVGFKGALSSEATIESLTVSDADGVWFTLEDVVLDWNRSALLRGRIDVEELSAARIIIARAPLSDGPTTPSPEAKPFSLPDLPVGITLNALNIQEIILGETFLGEEVRVSLTGNAALSDGEGLANIIATRLGDKKGVFEIDGAFTNEDRALALKLSLEEGPEGIAATLLDLPGRPATKLLIEGAAPLAEFAATIALATDGQDRIAGTFSTTAASGGQRIKLDIGGDVTPLFVPEYQDFFGDEVRLRVDAVSTPDAQVKLETFDLQAKSLSLQGSAEIGAQGWPARLTLTGQIKAQNGEVVLLPLSGPKTYVDDVTIALTYDAAISNDWTTAFVVKGFDRPGLYMGEIDLSGGGVLVQGEGDAEGEITADLRYAVNGLELDDAGAAQAFGDRITGVLQAARTEGSATQITSFTLNGPGLEAVADATIQGVKSGLRTQSNILLTVDALQRFSSLAGRDLAGSGRLALASTITPLDGLFDVILTGETDNLAIGVPQLDAVFKGRGRISASAVRDTDGTRLDTFNITTDAAELTASANITSVESVAEFDFAVADLALIEPQLTGPAALRGTASRDPEGVMTVDIDGTAKDTVLAVLADITPTKDGQTVNLDATAQIDDLRNYARIAGRDLAGAAALDISGVLLGDGQRFTATVGGTTRNLAVGMAQIDPLLRGDGTLLLDFARSGVDRFSLKTLDVATDATKITASGRGGLSGAAQLDLTANIADAAVLGQGLSGPVQAVVKIARDETENGDVSVRLNGPGTDVSLLGKIDPDLQFTGALNADVANLATYQSLIGQPVSGGVSARISGRVLPDLSAFEADISAQTTNLGIGNPVADILLAGNGRLSAAASLDAGSLQIDGLDVSTANLTLAGRLGGQAGAARGSFDARLRDVGVLTDQLSGPVTATGTASLGSDGRWGLDAQATGPGGITANASGQVSKSGQLNITTSGRAPLGLANTILEPRRLSGDAVFDLAINGPAALNSLSGRVDLRDAVLTAPTLAQGIQNIAGGVTLGNGTANIDITGDVKSGGSLAVSGPVALTGQFVADLALAVNNVVIKDPELYKTSLSGGITLRGPLAGGALVSGTIDLGQTDISVPSSGVGALGDLPNVTHLGASNAVQQTLNNAGIAVSGAAPRTSGSTARPYPLDITINAPSRIFIRGRGLDAELGGTLRIGGTTQNIVPTGVFELARGRLSILQQRFELTEGSATMQGDFIPYIRLVATTEARTGTRIDIIVEGPANEPEVSFVSVPSLPQDEVLSQLIFGRDLENISPLQAVQLAAAVGTLAGKGGGGLIDNFRAGIGLDDFDVTTDDEGNAAVSAGKYLSENVYTDVTVSSDGSTEINLNLDVTKEITAKGTVGADGETSIGVFFERDY